MLNISIDQTKAKIENTDLYAQWTVTTANAFGDIYAKLEPLFQGITSDSLASAIVKRIADGISGRPVDDPIRIFGYAEIGQTFLDMEAFIDGKSVLYPTFRDIEEMRIRHHMKESYLPISLSDPGSMRFEGLKTISHVVIAILYYYAFNDYKIVRCRHCGKWFATQTLKEQYCKRVSPCFGDIIKGKEKLPCEQAVRNIKQKQRRRYDAIYHNFYQKNQFSVDMTSFLSESYRLQEAIKEAPSVDNFKRYEDFLNKYPKRTVKK